MWVKGDVVARGRADIVEEILETPATGGGRWHLRALYFGKKFSTEIILDDMADARAATPADHEQARAYAARFKETEESSENAGIQTHTRPPNTPPQLELFPSPAGEGEPGSPGLRASRARGARGPSGGAARRRRRGGALKAYGWLVAAMCGRKPSG